ncbi:YdbC family protein [Amygdalobacter nucleatus]|uniref:YdbC family protein n=1 Tax=Amygdalobacter nucleatus TaxID=3029274 RepID=UPI0027A5F120|nr:PC4/YdbC family ssDNA-binding protein [Amygdalobacter nucleatus]WEG37280.1 PC4/YdbC family ssDNA-binding protein [Amygdalobacter nucleatus]
MDTQTTSTNRRREPNETVKFVIKRHIAVLSEANSGWKRELNIVAWNDGPERYDIRDWNPEHKKMGRGIGLNENEVAALVKALSA